MVMLYDILVGENRESIFGDCGGLSIDGVDMLVE